MRSEGQKLKIRIIDRKVTAVLKTKAKASLVSTKD